MGVYWLFGGGVVGVCYGLGDGLNGYCDYVLDILFDFEFSVVLGCVGIVGLLCV